jgi:hypothetical protein
MSCIAPFPALARSLALAGLLALPVAALAQAPDLTPAEARDIAAEAWLYAYAPLQGYQTMYNQAVNSEFPGYVGGFNQFRHYARSATPADTDIVTPNNDTPYSWAWLDLRAEPIVLSLPAVPAPRYYVNQWFDMYTHNFAYTGVRATGREVGTYLFAGPNWTGTVPEGITQVFRAETDFVGTLTRTQLFGPDDIPALQAVQAAYTLTPLSAFEGQPAPSPAPPVDWPAWDAAKAGGIGFIGYLNALLPFMPTPPSEQEMFARFARIGIAPAAPFDPDALPPEIRTAMEAGIAEASANLTAEAQKQTSSRGFFGTREELGADLVTKRNFGAMIGIYGNSEVEAFYGTQQTDDAGQALDGKRHWVLRFEPGQLPPVSQFWSITMYSLPQRLLVDNPIDRYSIGDRTAGLKLGPDGSMELYLQHENPGPERESNWLPAPDGPFFFVGRFYGPGPEILEGNWALPRLVERK